MYGYGTAESDVSGCDREYAMRSFVTYGYIMSLEVVCQCDTVSKREEDLKYHPNISFLDKTEQCRSRFTHMRMGRRRHINIRHIPIQAHRNLLVRQILGIINPTRPDVPHVQSILIVYRAELSSARDEGEEFDTDHLRGIGGVAGLGEGADVEGTLEGGTADEVDETGGGSWLWCGRSCLAIIVLLRSAA